MTGIPWMNNRELGGYARVCPKPHVVGQPLQGEGCVRSQYPWHSKPGVEGGTPRLAVVGYIEHLAVPRHVSKPSRDCKTASHKHA